MRNILVWEPLERRLTAAVRECLDVYDGRPFVGTLDPDALARALAPAVGRIVADALGHLAKQHEQRAGEVVGTSRAANAIRVAHTDAAEVAGNFARFYREPV